MQGSSPFISTSLKCCCDNGPFDCLKIMLTRWLHGRPMVQLSKKMATRNMVHPRPNRSDVGLKVVSGERSRGRDRSQPQDVQVARSNDKDNHLFHWVLPKRRTPVGPSHRQVGPEIEDPTIDPVEIATQRPQRADLYLRRAEP